MESFRVPRQSWVVVCDGAKALFLRNEGDAQLLNLSVVETLDQSNQKDRELGTDRPGRTFQTMAAGRSAMEETDWHAAAEADFLKSVAEKMSTMAYAKDMEKVLVVAPPKALGLMRPYYSKSLQDILSAELPKDLVKMPVDQIERHLAA